MFKVALINMPFASLNLPSFALTQLQSLVEEVEGVEAEICYLNQEFVEAVGLELNQYIVDSLEANSSGIGNWFFRQAAFPDLEDNSEQYFERYYPYRNENASVLRERVAEKRKLLVDFLDRSIDHYGLDQVQVVGLTSMFSQNTACFAMARRIKQRNPEVIVVMGGANCETPMGEEICKHIESVDFVFSGPALKSFPSFVRHCKNGDIEKCHEIRGVFSRQNLVTMQGTIGEELHIDTEIDLRYESFLDALDRNFPEGNITARLNFETSRGCWWGERAHCTFCGLNGSTMQYRSMKPELAIKQFETLFERYGARCSRFEAVDNILPKHYFKEVLDQLNPDPKISIFYEIKVDVTEDDVKILSKSGVREVQPGIESLATTTLKLMRKGTTAFKNIRFLKFCQSHGVFPFWNLLIGFPGEQEDVYKKYLTDLQLLVHLCPPDGVNPVRFDRFSPYFMKADEYKLDLHPYDSYALIYPFDEESLFNLAYYFMDHNIGAEYFLTMGTWINKIRGRVNDWRAKWKGKEHTEHPKLHFMEMEGRPVIYDSRGGEPVHHHLSDASIELLEHLTEPQTLRRLGSMASSLTSSQVEQEVEGLLERGLLFHEKDRYMSLVLDTEPQPVSGRTLYILEA